MSQVITRLRGLVDGAVPVDAWRPEIGSAVHTAFYGADEAQRFLEHVRALSDMFAANQGSAAALQSAFAGIRDTYTVVGESIDTFLAPAADQGTMTISRYRPLADGRLVTHISRQRGHCKRIAQVYIQSGGLRDSLPTSANAEVRQELDGLIHALSTADGDLFNAMASIGLALQDRAAVLVNLLLAGQAPEAEARLSNDETFLLPLRQKINEGMAEVERLSTELGIAL